MTKPKERKMWAVIDSESQVAACCDGSFAEVYNQFMGNRYSAEQHLYREARQEFKFWEERGYRIKKVTVTWGE